MTDSDLIDHLMERHRIAPHGYRKQAMDALRREIVRQLRNTALMERGREK